MILNFLLWQTFPILLYLFLIPGFLIIIVFCIPKNFFISIKTLVFSITNWIFFLSILLFIFFDSYTSESFQFFYNFSIFQLIPNFWNTDFLLHFNFQIGIDGISLCFILLTTFIIPLCILAAWEQKFDTFFQEKLFFASILLLESALIGTFISLDLFFFFIFFEITLIPLYFLVGIFFI